jgi:hypothetical protein
MEHSHSREAVSCAANHEIADILWIPKVPYCVHSSTPLEYILSHLNLVRKFSHCFFMIRRNIVL